MIPFILNKEQLYIQNLLEKMKRLTGKVRAIIVKGRQQGCSTLVSARFYHKTIFIPNTSVFIFINKVDFCFNF